MQGEVIDSAVAASDFGGEVEIRRTLQKGRPADTLKRAAARAAMLVVGNRGRGGFAGLRLGSVSQAIAHHSPCPLVIVRTGLADDLRLPVDHRVHVKEQSLIHIRRCRRLLT